jgi:hypothetical protein
MFVVLYGCETWSLTSRQGHRVNVFENRVLRKIFRPKRDEVTREWRRLHNEELYDLYSSPNIIRDQIRKNETCRACSTHTAEKRWMQDFGVEVWGNETTWMTQA